MKKSLSIILILGIILAIGCDEPDCISQTTNFANAKFYKTDTNEIDTIFNATVTILDTDITLVVDTTTTSLKLPLRPDQTETTFIFNSNFGIDTVTIQYVYSSRLVSEECGIETIFSELNTTGSGFDSVRVVNSILVDEIDENVKIFN